MAANTEWTPYRGREQWMGRARWVGHSEGQRTESCASFLPACGLPPTGSGLPMKDCERNRPQVAREVREATDGVLDALRHVGTCLGSPPGWPGPWRSIAVSAWPAGSHSPLCRSVWLSVWRDIPAVTFSPAVGARLPGVLQLLPEPGWQCLAHLVQQLGKLDVVVPVIVLQEGTGIQVHLRVLPALAFA